MSAHTHSVPPATPPPQPGLSLTWFQDLIPELVARSEAFRISTDAVDEEALCLFADEIRLAIRGLSAAIADRDGDGIRRQAHSLQGMGGTAGSPEISVVGEELSRCARQNDFGRCAELTTRLDGWQMQWAPEHASGAAATPETPRLEGRILVVDDGLPNRQFLRKLLTDSGAEVTVAENGERALELARELDLDVALVDVVMPGLSGYEVCQRLVADPATCHVAVIMVTAQSTVEDIEHAFVLGAFDYIRKPFHARELLARVRNALELKRQGDELRQWQTRMSHELNAAGALQRKLLNTDPFFGQGVTMHCAYQSSLTVGGDVFDIIRLPNDRMCLYVGDVAGHGVGPAMISTLLKALVSEVVRESADRGPAAMCTEIHRRFRVYVTNPEVYATLFIALFDARSRQCLAFNCGHPMPLLFAPHGQAAPLFADRGGLPIGLPSENGADVYSPADEVQAVLPPEATLFIFTDGLPEARRQDSGVPCGEENLGATLAGVAADPDIIDPAQETFRRLADQGYQLAQDDCTLIVLQTLDPAGIRLERTVPLTHASMSTLAADTQQLLRNEGWPEEAAYAAQLLVMEHGANVVNHARAPAESGLDVQIRLTGGMARLLFRDHGREWDFKARAAAFRRQPAHAESGRGLAIIRALAKQIEVIRRDGENTTLYSIDRNIGTDVRTAE